VKNTLIKKREGKEIMEITLYQVQGKVPVTVLQPHGDLDASNFRDLIARAKDAYDAGGRDILLDLSDTPYLSSSGLVALHSIATMLRGEAPPDLESGWGAFRSIGRDRDLGLQQHFKLFNPQPNVEKVLEMAGFRQYLEVYADLETAAASF
jgi:anti-anti-sigma regulatory factor